jgi:hypothetical protein
MSSAGYTNVFGSARERRESVIASEAWLHPSFDHGLLKEIFNEYITSFYMAKSYFFISNLSQNCRQ